MVPYTALASPNAENHRLSPNRTAKAPTSATSAPGQAARRPAGDSGRTRSSSTSNPKRIANGSTRVTANCAAATIQQGQNRDPTQSAGARCDLVEQFLNVAASRTLLERQDGDDAVHDRRAHAVIPEQGRKGPHDKEQ